MQIGTILKNKRLELDMSQIDIAQRSGITQSMISKIERGANENVTIENLRRLAGALNCLVVDLLPDEDKTIMKS